MKYKIRNNKTGETLIGKMVNSTLLGHIFSGVDSNGVQRNISMSKVKSGTYTIIQEIRL